MRLSSLGFGLVLLALTPACTLTLPEPIYMSQVASHFDASLPAGVRNDAEICASRLNKHIDRAAEFNGIRVGVTAVGGVAAGAGGVVAAAASKDDQKQAAAIVAAVGGGVALIGTFLLGVIGDPSDRLDRHSRGVRSWDEATTEADAAVAATGANEKNHHLQKASAALTRCRNDQAPPSAQPPIGVAEVPVK
jgi:hypothetical protein